MEKLGTFISLLLCLGWTHHSLSLFVGSADTSLTQLSRYSNTLRLLRLLSKIQQQQQSQHSPLLEIDDVRDSDMSDIRLSGNALAGRYNDDDGDIIREDNTGNWPEIQERREDDPGEELYDMDVQMPQSKREKKIDCRDSNFGVWLRKLCQ